jgi:hypothetical protein
VPYVIFVNGLVIQRIYAIKKIYMARHVVFTCHFEKIIFVIRWLRATKLNDGVGATIESHVMHFVVHFNLIDTISPFTSFGSHPSFRDDLNVIEISLLYVDPALAH